MTREERLEHTLKAVLLFHDGEPWTAVKRERWWNLTFLAEATTHNLCDHIRAALDHPRDKR